MMRKLRIFVAAALLVPAMFSNANAFTTENDGALNPARPRPEICVFYWNGVWYRWEC